MPRRADAPRSPAEIGAFMKAECLAMRARLLGRVVTQIYDDALRPLGLKTSQLSILAALAMMDAPRPTDLAEALRLEQSTVSRNLSVMVRAGWVEVLPAEDDRTKRLGLTPTGAELLRQAFPLWQRAQKEAQAVLSEEGRDALVTLGGLLGGPAVSGSG